MTNYRIILDFKSTDSFEARHIFDKLWNMASYDIRSPFTISLNLENMVKLEKEVVKFYELLQARSEHKD